MKKFSGFLVAFSLVLTCGLTTLARADSAVRDKVDSYQSIFLKSYQDISDSIDRDSQAVHLAVKFLESDEGHAVPAADRVDPVRRLAKLENSLDDAAVKKEEREKLLFFVDQFKNPETLRPQAVKGALDELQTSLKYAKAHLDLDTHAQDHAEPKYSDDWDRLIKANKAAVSLLDKEIKIVKDLSREAEKERQARTIAAIKAAGSPADAESSSPVSIGSVYGADTDTGAKRPPFASIPPR